MLLPFGSRPHERSAHYLSLLNGLLVRILSRHTDSFTGS
jgi:hypothetical protein